MLGQVIRRLGARPDECFFWATRGAAALDLLVVRGSKRRGFEFNRTSAPKRTRSMTIASNDLRLDTLDVLHAGEQTFPIGERMRAVATGDLLGVIDPL